MIVNVREKKFKDKETQKEICYKEFYITFDCLIGEKVEKLDLPLKIEDKFAKEMLAANINTADFNVVASTSKDNRVFYNPVIKFKCGSSDYRIPVKLSAEGIILARIALDIN